MNEKDYEKALNFLTIAYHRKQDPEYATQLNSQNLMFQSLQFNNLGIVHYKLKKPKLALFYLNKVLNLTTKLNPNNEFSKNDILAFNFLNKNQPFVYYNFGMVNIFIISFLLQHIYCCNDYIFFFF